MAQGEICQDQRRNGMEKNTTMTEFFEQKLREDEKSEATVKKYVRDVQRFAEYVGENPITKERVICYKQYLSEHYTVSSVNSMLAAVNSFLQITGYPDCRVKAFRMQREAFRKKEKELSREEYIRLLEAAKCRKNKRLYLLMQTMGATGIRISELPFITVESLDTRRAQVSLKGKIRIVLLPGELCLELKKYVREKKILKGSIFVTRSGKPVDRSNILHEMKGLCEEAEVLREKVFPHNFRHLFAVTYYKAEHDICHLADLLGHSNINTTRIYTLVSCEEQEKQIEGLGLMA